MVSRRMIRESFDAVMQAKSKRYSLDRSDPIDEALHQLRVNSRPALQTRYDDDFRDEEKYRRSDWREDLGDDYSLPSYRSNRSSSPAERDDDYYTKAYTHPLPRSRDYGRPPPVKQDYSAPSSRDGDYGRPASRDRDYIPSREPARVCEADYGSSEPRSDFRSPGLLDEDYAAPISQDYGLEYRPQTEREFSSSFRDGRGRSSRGKRGMVTSGLVRKDVSAAPIRKWNTKHFLLPSDSLADPEEHPKPRPVPSQLVPRPPRPTLPPRLEPVRNFRSKEPNLDHVDPTDIFSTFGVEIIKWAGFDQIKRDPEYLELYRVLFTLETETCAKMLASFKCSLKPEHQDFCFSIVKALRHSALKTPKVDNKLLNLLLEKKAMLTKNCFFEVIKPFDQYMMRLQDRLLKSTTPLLMACNAYELSIKTSSFNDPAQMAAAFETTVSLCRKSLALLGQTFALASTFRQEKILEAIGLGEAAPSPTLFPNFDTCTLFGTEYIENLEGWLEKSGYRLQLKKAAAPDPSPRNQRDVAIARRKIPQRADRKVAETIEKLVNGMISGTLSGREKAELRGNPEYWFLHETESLEHKYYKLKLAEMERLMSPAKEEAQPKKTAEQRASQYVQTLLYARKIASIKKRLFRRRRPGILQRAGRRRKAKNCTVGTQTLLSAGTMLKRTQGSAPPAGSSLGKEVAAAATAEAPPEEDPGAKSLLELAGSSQSGGCLFPDVDAKTMDTAEKLAEFVAQFGPEIEQFSIDNSAGNPDLWFLQDRESSAFKYYRTKVCELRPSISFDALPETGSSELVEGDEEDLEEGEEEEEEASQMEAERAEEWDEEEEAIPADEAAKMEDSGVAGEGQDEGTSLDPSTQASGPGRDVPFHRKRISSKTLRVGMIPSKRVCLIEDPQVHEPVRIAYDRPRGCPPYKKKKAKDSEAMQKKLTQKNIGFQMLQKMGWQEGRGLGPRGKGIKEPIKVNSSSAREGFGVAGQERKEDTFDVFRQRMIQMYNLKKVCK